MMQKQLKMFFYEVIVPVALDIPFTYSSEHSIENGTIVTVPFRSGKMKAVVYKKVQQPNLKNIKAILEPLPFHLNKATMQFILWVASYSLQPVGMVFKMLIGPYKQDTKNQQLEYRLNPQPITLNTEQQAIYNDLRNRSSFHVALLEGITGSGKTEVYLSLIADAIEEGKQALVLLPEIVLTTQLLERFKQRLGEHAAYQWHSSLTPVQRQKIWENVANGNIKLIVGARSSLFLPFQNLATIVVDEEHDPSYKQETNVIYNARDCAVMRAKHLNIPILLASATPSIESLQNATNGKYTHYIMQSRYGAGQLPDISLLHNKNRDTVISNKLIEEIDAVIQNGHQAMVFINRRGYAPFSVCSSCNHNFACLDCDLQLIYHKHINKLLCHHCGAMYSMPTECPKCHEKDVIVHHGFGAEKAYEYIVEKLPNTTVELFTSDTINTHNKARNAIKNIEEGRTQVIVGTQMLAKGLHFPKLNFIAILGVDNALSFADFRAFERTYQLITQVSGRAGRESKQGRVVIESYSELQDDLWRSILTQNRKQFIALELQNRKAFQMPPFSRIALINIKANKENALLAFVQHMASKIPPNTTEVDVMGPNPAPIYLLNKMYRYQFIVKAQKLPQKFIKHWLYNIGRTPSGISITVDIDTQTFL